jgi:predicted GNAT family N-acyltransferase
MADANLDGRANPFSLAMVEWRLHAQALRAIRTQVFVVEQNVPAELERDGLDPECAHVLARSSSSEPIGTGRLMPGGRIGRMAVLAAWRGRGVGAAMLEALMAEARRQGLRETFLHAQSHAKDFYARHGYVAVGEEYLEAGIPHVEMRARL